MDRTSSSAAASADVPDSPTRRGLSKARFDEIYRDGKRAKGEFCRLIALPGEGRIGFATPKVLGSNARRNRVKRRFRAAVMKMVRPTNLDIVVAIAASADQIPFETLRNDLAGAMERMRERWEKESESS